MQKGTPQELVEALAGDREATTKWERLAASHKREYIRWVVSAKREETRARRAAQALEMLKGKR